MFTEIRPLDDIAKNILQKRYFRNNEKSWEELTNRVVNHIIKKKDKRYKDIYNMLLYRCFIPNSPCLVNAGMKNGGLSACFVVDFKDSIEEIYKTKLDFALIAKKGGGCGTTLSHIRPENDTVEGSSHGFAGGAVKFFDTICNDMKAMTQAGFREMAMMGTMTVYHPDIIKFITAKENEGVMHTTNISVVVDKPFIEKVKNNETYWTIFNGKKYKELNARDVFEKIVEGAWKNGEPGIIFDEKVNNSPYKHTGQKIFATNPCLTADMKILTSNGYIPIGELKDKYVNIINNNGEVSKGKVWYSGNKETIILRLSNNDKIKCTPNHIFMSVTGDEIKAEDSKGCQFMPFLARPILNDIYIGYGYAQGDGNLTRLKSDKHLGIEINIGDKDKDMLDFFDIYPYNEMKSGRVIYVNNLKKNLIKLGFSSEQLPTRIFPTTYDSWEWLDKSSFLNGCFSANGTINNHGRICYKSTSKNFILKLQETLENDFGISSYITTNKAHPIEFSNGVYTVKESYDINISAYNGKLIFYNNINFSQKYKIEKLLRSLLENIPYVASIKDNGLQDVYDFSEPINHWGVVENYVTHNCGEQGLPPNGVCNLGSLDISKFWDNKKKDLNWDLLEKAIRLSVYFLDKTIDVNIFPTEEISQWAKDNRPVGLGVMAIADYFIQKEIPYGSEKSLDVLDKLLKFMYQIALDESIKLGKEFGIPKECKKLPIKRRNITILSVAPTGTISLLAGCSNGIEPIFSELTQRKDKTGEYSLHHPLYDKPYFRCAVSSNGGTEVTWEEHINIQNISQKYVDSGVSKTINFPNHTKRQTIYNAFIMASDLPYIKGITVYRNGSREIEVLSPKNIKKDKCPECGGNLIKESNCKHCEKCDFSLCEIG